MPRIRNVKPELFLDSALCRLPIPTRYFFIGLFTQADRRGIVVDDPVELRVKLLAYEEGLTSADVAAMLDDLARPKPGRRAGFIRRYWVGERRLLQILQFDKHQKFHRDEKPNPDLPGPECETPAPVDNSQTPAVIDDACAQVLTPERSTLAAPCQHPVSTPDVGRLTSDVRSSSPPEKPAGSARTANGAVAFQLEPAEPKPRKPNAVGLFLARMIAARREAFPDAVPETLTESELKRFAIRFAAVLKLAGDDGERLFGAYENFLRDRHWAAQSPPCPWGAFVTDGTIRKCLPGQGGSSSSGGAGFVRLATVPQK